MYKYILNEGANINWMALFALLTFCLIFFGNIVLLFIRRKGYMDKMASMPLDEAKSINQN